MYELPQTLLHLTGPTLQGAFCWEQTWRTPNNDRQPVHKLRYCLVLEHEVLVQLCSWEQTIPFIIYLLPRNLPLPDAFYCHTPHGGPASNIVFMYVYGRSIMHAVSGRAAATLTMYHVPLPSLPLFIILYEYLLDRQTRLLLFVCCITWRR